MSAAEAVIEFAESLCIPLGPDAGKPLRFALYQRDITEAVCDPENDIVVVGIGRGNAKSTLAAIIALCALVGIMDPQPHRQILIAARTAEQARQLLDIIAALIPYLPESIRAKIKVLKAPRLECRFDAEDGPHFIKVISSDGKSALGAAPLLCIMDERAAWAPGRGEELESALLTALGKVGGKAIIISTSGPDDLNPFSVWLDEEVPGVYRREFRADMSLPPDSDEAILQANPGAAEDPPIGASLETLRKMAKQAVARGGSALTSFRLYNLNQRVHDSNREALCTVDEWLQIETAELPEREGVCILGLDVGESVSMSAAAAFWPASGRLEVHAWLPHNPTLADRGANDGVRDRYQKMHERQELSLIGDRVVPVAEWVQEVFLRLGNATVAAIVADHYKQSLVYEGLQQAGITTPVILRRNGWYHGGEDCTRARNCILDKRVQVQPSLLLRSAVSDAVIESDGLGNMRLAKGKSTGKIDAIAATVLALGEGDRRSAQPKAKPARYAWA